MLGEAKFRYGLMSRFLHWFVAILIGWQMLKLTDYITDGEHWVGENLVPWHISIGVLLLALIGFRIVWATRRRVRRMRYRTLGETMTLTGHIVLYATMMVMPLTGILKMVGGGHGLTAFGFVLVPDGPRIAPAARLGEWHAELSWLLLALIVGHIVIATAHRFKSSSVDR